MNNSLSLVDNYFQITKKYSEEYGERTILLLQVGTFYEMYGAINKDEIIEGSKIQEIMSICDLQRGKYCCKTTLYPNMKLCMAGFTTYNLDKYLKIIQENGFTAIVFNQTPEDKQKRELFGIFSPGTYFVCESKQVSNNCMCVWINKTKKLKTIPSKIICGISNIDIYTGKSYIYEFEEKYSKNINIYDELERYISINIPNELIIISNLDDSEINNICLYININCNLVHKININNKDSDRVKKVLNCEKQTYQKIILEKSYTINDYNSFQTNFMRYEIAKQSFCYLLEFIQSHNYNLTKKIREPEIEMNKNNVVLANHTLKQLNILPDNNYSGIFSCVLYFLDKCITNVGKRDFKQMILNPITDTKILQKSYDIIEYYISNYDKNEYIRNMLIDVKDIEKLNRRIFLKNLTPDALFQLYNSIVNIDKLYNKVLKDDIIFSYVIENIKENISHISNEIIKLIERTFILDECNKTDTLQFNNIIFNRGVNIYLDKKIQQMLESQDKLESIRKYLNDILYKCEKKGRDDMVKIHSTEKNGQSIVATKRRCNILEKEIKNINNNNCNIVTLNFISSYDSKENNFDFDITNISFIDSTASNKTITTKYIYNLCNSITKSLNEIKDILHETYMNFLNSIEDYNDKINEIVVFISNLDLLQSKCYIAKKYNYCKPNIIKNDKSFIDVSGLRHCLIENIQKDELYVTNDIILGKEKTGMLLYGTNAVGKTSFIKALGISIIMAQTGMYVPATKYNYSPYHEIFTRILNTDNMFKGMSTFAVEMAELRIILKYCNKNSLILGDELCSGTENDSAIGIFVSGLHFMHKQNATFIFATHMHEIVNYEEIEQFDKLTIKHMEVIYNHDTDTLEYNRKLQDGPGNSNYGLEVCKSLHLDNEFIEYAYIIRQKYGKYVNKEFLSMSTSKYNSRKIKTICEICKNNIGEDIHHINPQREVNKNNFINNEFHKNHMGNLISVCSKCHDDIHKSNKKYRKTKTTKGVILKEL